MEFHHVGWETENFKGCKQLSPAQKIVRAFTFQKLSRQHERPLKVTAGNIRLVFNQVIVLLEQSNVYKFRS